MVKFQVTSHHLATPPRRLICSSPGNADFLSVAYHCRWAISVYVVDNFVDYPPHRCHISTTTLVALTGRRRDHGGVPTWAGALRLHDDKGIVPGGMYLTWWYLRQRHLSTSLGITIRRFYTVGKMVISSRASFPHRRMQTRSRRGSCADATGRSAPLAGDIVISPRRFRYQTLPVFDIRKGPGGDDLILEGRV